MRAIFNRELDSHFSSLTGNIFCAFILLFAGIYTMVYNLNGLYTNFEYVPGNMCFIYAIAIPILTMRSIAEERRQKTDQLLYSLPLPMSRIVMGKYLSMVAVLAVPVIIMCFYPLILSQYGNVALATCYGTLLGFFLLGAALISIGLFLSSLTENQGIAAGITVVVILLLYFMSSLSSYIPTTAFGSYIAIAVVFLALGGIIWFLTKNPSAALFATVFLEAALFFSYKFWPSFFEGLFASVLAKISVFDRFYLFIYGVFDLTAVVYFLSIIAVFLYLTVQSLEKRRWS